MTGNEQTEVRAGDGFSRRTRGAYRNFLSPRRPSEIFAPERGRPDMSVCTEDLEPRAAERDGEPV